MPNTLNLLHIEDDSTDAHLMRDLIHKSRSHYPIDITHASDLKSAIKHMKDSQFDAVLLDLNLRELAGPDNVRIINEEAPDMPIIVLSGDADIAKIRSCIDQGAQDYIIKGHCDGTSIEIAIRSSIQRKSNERLLYLQANYDDLTGLPNRRHITTQLKKRLSRNSIKRTATGLIYFGVDDMRSINRKFGITTGNYHLQEVSLRVKQILDENSFLGRHNGDEFLIVLSSDEIDVLHHIERIAEKISIVTSAPFSFADEDYNSSVSIGLTFSEDSRVNAQSAIIQAKSAMIEAKILGGNRICFYEPAMMAA